MRAILIVGGAPRLALDAVRHLTVRATGTTAVRLRELLGERAVACDLLLSHDAVPAEGAARYRDRQELDDAVRAWLRAHGDGVVVMSAAVNDYAVRSVERVADGVVETMPPGAKIASRADELVIRLGPAPKLIDALGEWGHTGPLVGFKFEDAASVIASAQRLRSRTGAAVVVANSLDGNLQALVGDEVDHFDTRPALLTGLADRLAALAAS